MTRSAPSPAATLVAALTLAVTACAQGSGGPQDAHYQGSCGDGTVLFVDGADGCPSTEPASFVAFTSLPDDLSAPMTLTIDALDLGGYTVGAGTCKSMKSGTLDIATYDSGSGDMSGSFDVTYTDDSKGQGDFNAAYCPGLDPCG